MIDLLESGRGKQVGNCVVFGGECMADPIQMTKHSDEVYAIKGSGSNKKFTPIDEVLERIKQHDAEIRAEAARVEVAVDPEADVAEVVVRELVILQGDYFGFPKEYKFSEIANNIQVIHDDKFKIKRKEWRI